MLDGSPSARRFGLITACPGAAQTVLLALVPAIVANTGLALSELGVLVAVGTLALMFASPIWAAWADTYGRRRILLWALSVHAGFQLLFVAALLALAFGHLTAAGAIALLALARIGHGFSLGGIHPVCQAEAVSLVNTTTDRLRALATVSAGGSLGKALGPLLVLALVPLGAMAPLLWLLVLPVAGWAVVYRAVGNTGAAVKPAVQGGLSGEFRYPLWRAAPTLALALMTAFGLGQAQFLVGPIIERSSAFSLQTLTAITAAALTAATATALIMQVWLAARGRRPLLMLWCGAAVMVLAAMLLQGANSVLWIVASLCLLAVAAALLVPAYTTLITTLTGLSRSRAMAWLLMAHTAGNALAFACAGALFERVDALPLVGILSAAVAAAVLVFATHRRSVSNSSNYAASVATKVERIRHV